ncbi:MAG: biosynthetic-type acetolactate synthase large subunit [Muribaculaceae bacterium]
MSNQITGAEALIKALIAEGADTIFGYPGGAIIPVFDCLYDYREELRHILVRHEQGATHAAQGYARVSGKTGVVIVTSGPGATNVITGISDAMMDSTPLVVITGQISGAYLGTDAFQETDVIGITQPVTKWSYQIRNAEDIPWAVARAFYIASTGRPGPVVLDFAKNAQVGLMDWNYKKCKYIRSYIPRPEINKDNVATVAQLINSAKRPMIISGHGVMISGAEKELIALAEKADIPVVNTLLGLSTIPTNHPLYKGLLGMHGNIGPNYHTLDCDLLIAIGMRFDDRVTGDAKKYAKQAKIVHIDIDESEFDKNVKTFASIHGDARDVIKLLTPLVNKNNHSDWIASFTPCEETELEKVINKEVFPTSGPINMGEVAYKVSQATNNDAILVTDVGQNQMLSSRYFKYNQPKSIVTSGGLGTMGFGLPAAIGAKIGAPSRTVCFFTGDGGIQMTVEELGVILQYGIDIKIIILNNNFLGMVRQWQQLFFNERYSETPMTNPNFVMLANAYGIAAENVETREEIDDAINRMIKYKGSYILNVNIDTYGMVFPMIPAGGEMTNILLTADEKYKHD